MRFILPIQQDSHPTPIWEYSDAGWTLPSPLHHGDARGSHRPAPPNILPLWHSAFRTGRRC
jgi:hypothetical protein